MAVMVWKGSQVPRDWGNIRRGRRRNRGVKGNQGVGDFRFINILHFFSIYHYYYLFIIFSLLFLPTTFTHTHTHDPRPLPTTHDPRHLATLCVYTSSNSNEAAVQISSTRQRKNVGDKSRFKRCVLFLAQTLQSLRQGLYRGNINYSLRQKVRF